MARIRTIKPDFPQSESMGKVSRDARLTFVNIFTIADDFGRLRGNSRMLASLLFPYDDDARGSMDGWLEELERENCIVRYEAEGSNYIQIVNWDKHQRVDKPSTSKIPPPREDSREPREDSRSLLGREGKGKEEEGKEEKPSSLRSEGKKTGPEKKPKPEIPDWLPAEAWRAYAEMRQKTRRPMTPRAVELAIAKLAELRSRGHDPTGVLEQSVFNSWQGLFAPKAQESREKSSVRKVI